MGLEGKEWNICFKGLLWLGKFQSVQIRLFSRCLPGVSIKKMLFLPLNSSLPSITALTFTPGGVSSPLSCNSSFSQATSSQDFWSLLCTTLLTTPSLPPPEGKLLWSETRSWRWRKTALSNPRDVGDGQLEAAMATAGSPSSLSPRFPADYIKTTDKITVAGNQRTLFLHKITWPVSMFLSTNPWHPRCWFNNLVTLVCTW